MDGAVPAGATGLLVTSAVSGVLGLRVASAAVPAAFGPDTQEGEKGRP